MALSTASSMWRGRRLPRVRSLSQIFVGGEHIGGYEDLQRLEDTGRLDAVPDAAWR